MFKFLKRFGRSPQSRQSPAARLPSFRPGVEQLGAGVRTAARAAKRPSFRPEAERLEDRLVQSSSGAISAITDLRGQTVVFMVRADDQQVYYHAGLQTYVWLSLTDWRNHSMGTFRQVSAGLDGSGRAVCYALNTNGHLWKLDSYGSWWDAWDLGALAGGFIQISATRNNECYALGANRTIYLFNANDWSYKALVYANPGFVQISAGVDQFGRDVVYGLNANHNVLEDHDDVTWRWLPIQANQISAGAGWNWTGTDLFYTAVGSNNAYYFDGTSSRYLMASAIQISAGLDQWGNEILLEIYSGDHALYRSDIYGHWQYEGGPMTQISAAGNDMVFAVTPIENHVWTFDPNNVWGGYWAWRNDLSSDWHYLPDYQAINPLYAPLSP
jgi:hypothetical protein